VSGILDWYSAFSSVDSSLPSLVVGGTVSAVLDWSSVSGSGGSSTCSLVVDGTVSASGTEGVWVE